jgi:hypothetical protein
LFRNPDILQKIDGELHTLVKTIVLVFVFIPTTFQINNLR